MKVYVTSLIKWFVLLIKEKYVPTHRNKPRNWNADHIIFKDRTQLHKYRRNFYLKKLCHFQISVITPFYLFQWQDNHLPLSINDYMIWYKGMTRKSSFMFNQSQIKCSAERYRSSPHLRNLNSLFCSLLCSLFYFRHKDIKKLFQFFGLLLQHLFNFLPEHRAHLVHYAQIQVITGFCVLKKWCSVLACKMLNKMADALRKCSYAF